GKSLHINDKADGLPLFGSPGGIFVTTRFATAAADGDVARFIVTTVQQTPNAAVGFEPQYYWDYLLAGFGEWEVDIPTIPPTPPLGTGDGQEPGTPGLYYVWRDTASEDGGEDGDGAWVEFYADLFDRTGKTMADLTVAERPEVLSLIYDFGKYVIGDLHG
ncbi:hypothetical protein, partial [Klebsiella pneumoniae]|uniref:hypothetical protein n=1 Tax=Klebsiella pneumoniae TaxID=573 RepID=UPI0027384AAC